MPRLLLLDQRRRERVHADPGVYARWAARARDGGERGERKRKRETGARGIYSCRDTETRNYVAAGLGARRVDEREAFLNGVKLATSGTFHCTTLPRLLARITLVFSRLSDVNQVNSGHTGADKTEYVKRYYIVSLNFFCVNAQYFLVSIYDWKNTLLAYVTKRYRYHKPIYKTYFSDTF